MTDSIQGVAEVEAVISSSAAAAAGQAIKAKFANLWPLAILGLGLALTVAWNASLFWSLFWLLYSVVV
jgi:hypothetical protein